MFALREVSSTLLLVVIIFSTIEKGSAGSTCPNNNDVVQSGNNNTHATCDKTSLGDHCTYKCLEGYGGVTNVTCLTSGQWSDQFSCLKITCPDETNLNHGSTNCIGAEYGETCSYKCDSFHGSGQTVTCEGDGQWSATPVCGGSSLINSLYVIAVASFIQQLIVRC